MAQPQSNVMAENQNNIDNNPNDNEINHKQAADTPRVTKTPTVVQARPSRPTRMAAQEAEKTKNQKPHHSHAREIITVAVVIAVIMAIGLCWLYNISNDSDDDINTTELYEGDDESVDPVINLLSQFGTIKMTGLIGAVPNNFEMDFNIDEGCRYFSSSPVTKYVVKLRHADIDSDENYHIVLTDYLEGRVAIGRFDGILSNDGSVFTGKYVSSHGKVREFKFEK